MTASATTIKKIGKRFKRVLSGGGADCISFGAMDTELSGGTLFARRRLHSVAVRAGRAIDRAEDADGFKTWVALLHERYAELSEEGFLSMSAGVPTEEPERRDVPFSQINPPPKSKGAPKKVAARVKAFRRREAQILLEKVPHLLVKKASSGRYAVIDKYITVYDAYRTLGYSEAKCAVLPPPVAPPPRGTKGQVGDIVQGKDGRQYRLAKFDGATAIFEPVEREYVQIDLFCQASIMLCKLLEAEAGEHEQEAAGGSEPPSSPDVVTGDDANNDASGSRSSTGEKPETFPNRASWLREQMGMREMTVNGLSSASTLDRKTILKIQKGRPVHDLVLQKLAKVLSLYIEDIPPN